MTKDKDTDEAEVTAVDAEVDQQLATGVAPAWATDPTTNKNAASRLP